MPRPYPPETRGQAIGMLRKGTMEGKVSRILHIHKSTLSKWWMQYQRDPERKVPKPKKPPGRPTLVSLSNLLTIKRQLDRDPFLTARALRFSVVDTFFWKGKVNQGCFSSNFHDKQPFNLQDLCLLIFLLSKLIRDSFLVYLNNCGCVCVCV